MAAVHERNGTLHQRELERQAALEQWEAAVVAYHLERDRLTESIANPGSGIQAATLTGAALLCEAHRDRVAGAAKALADADELLAAASSAAMEARAIYRRTLARQDALLTLQTTWQKAQRHRGLRLEEQEA
jgi:hypothetical protein